MKNDPYAKKLFNESYLQIKVSLSQFSTKKNCHPLIMSVFSHL